MLGLTVYSAQQRGCGRGVAAAALRWWLPSAPPRTRWCARVEADHVLVPAQVNIADMSYNTFHSNYCQTSLTCCQVC